MKMHFSGEGKRKQPFWIFLKIAETSCPCYFIPPAQVMDKVVHAKCGDREDCLSVMYEELGALCGGKGGSS